MQPGDRLICAFVKPLTPGAEFKLWPLHVTIVPWFRVEISLDRIAKEIGDALTEVQPFEAVVGGEAHFGRNKLVNLVRQPTPLMEIEKKVRSVLKSHDAWIVDETTKRRRSYRPHVTEQKSERVHEGDSFLVNRFYVVEQLGGSKKVVELVRF